MPALRSQRLRFVVCLAQVQSATYSRGLYLVLAARLVVPDAAHLVIYHRLKCPSTNQAVRRQQPHFEKELVLHY